MTGTIKKTFPKPGEKGTWVVVISPNDNSPDIYEEMNAVTSKTELPEIGTEVKLVPAFPTWKVGQ